MSERVYRATHVLGRAALRLLGVDTRWTGLEHLPEHEIAGAGVDDVGLGGGGGGALGPRRAGVAREHELAYSGLTWAPMAEIFGDDRESPWWNLALRAT